MKNIIVKTVLLLWVIAPLRAAAWGQNGHRIVGQIANNHLSKRAKKGIAKILGSENTAFASTWGDFIKSDHQYDYLYNWHFVNMPSGWTEAQVDQYLDTASAPNVYHKSLELIAQLKSGNTPLAQKQLALRMLIHMVGDMHQPMHLGHLEDLGGNKIELFWFNKPSNLHALWDENLLESQSLSFSEYTQMIDHASAAQIENWQAGGLKNWIFESYEIASKLYSEVQPQQKLSYRYIYDHLDTMNLQLEKGGLRLAKILNDIFA